MAIASDRFGQRLSLAFALGLLVIGEGFAIAEEPLRRDVGASQAGATCARAFRAAWRVSPTISKRFRDRTAATICVESVR